MEEGEYEIREWLPILRNYLMGEAVRVYQQIAIPGETTHEQVKDGMLECLSRTTQQSV